MRGGMPRRDGWIELARWHNISTMHAQSSIVPRYDMVLYDTIQYFLISAAKKNGYIGDESNHTCPPKLPHVFSFILHTHVDITNSINTFSYFCHSFLSSSRIVSQNDTHITCPKIFVQPHPPGLWSLPQISR